MTTNSPGIATIWFSDNVRQPASLMVEVVPDTVSLATNAFSIQFNNAFLRMQGLTNQTIPNYTIRNLQGQIVGGVPDFFLENASLGNVNGNVIQSGSNSGMTTLRAVLNGDTLDGRLTVVVRSNTSTVADTFWTLYPSKVTSAFNYYQRTAEPIVLDVVEAICPPGPGFSWPTISFYTTSPLSITISNDKILKQNNGRLISVGPGLAQLTAYYKGGSWLKWNTRVRIDYSGFWYFNAQNGKKINVCFSPNGSWDGITYTKWGSVGFDTFNYLIEDNGEALVENADGTYDTTFFGTSVISRGAATFSSDSLQTFDNFWLEVPSSGFLYSYTCQYYPYQTRNKFTGWANGNPSITITGNRGGDGCTPTGGGGQSLQQVLSQDTSRIWSQGPDFVDYFDYSISDIQFTTSSTFIDHTPYDINDFYTVPGSTTWSTTPDNQKLILNYTQAVNQGTISNPNYTYYSYTDSLDVSAYSNVKFNIKGIWSSSGQGYVNLSNISSYLFWE
jgi:hypothetical protein